MTFKNVKDKTLMRVNRQLLNKLKEIRITERESYAEVVERLYKNRRR